ncbi:hypothetical protein [Flavobacterium sp.]|uniref:hypothetical protein n=1 Tax=Flavobacterium sp. TaxID=239 RepID=UPI00374DCB6F
MIQNIQNLDRKTKYSLFITTLVLAVFAMLVINVVVSIIHMLDLIKEPSFETISLAFKEGYYTINDKKIGIPILFNIVGGFILWLLMLYHTIRSIYNLDFFLDNFNDFN